MKTKLNFLCIMLLILMVVGMVIACLAGVSDFKRGYEDGVNATTSSTNDIIIGLVVLASFRSLCLRLCLLCALHPSRQSWRGVHLDQCRFAAHGGLVYRCHNNRDVFGHIVLKY